MKNLPTEKAISNGLAASEVAAESNTASNAVSNTASNAARWNRMKYNILQLVSRNEDQVLWQAESSLCQNLEIACHEALKPLQGSIIPELLDVITILVEDGPCNHGLVLSWMEYRIMLI